jgi:uncharacterized protein YdaU (DUF1376 family)
MTMHYIPLYTGDYLRDTRHLSPMEHGIYLLLLMYCWDKHGFAPLEERQLFGICNARSNDEMEAVRRVLKEFFVQGAEGWYNPRLMRELDEAHAKHEAAIERMRLGSEYGRKSAEARRAKYGTAQPKRVSRKNAGSTEGTFVRPSGAPSGLPSEGIAEGLPNKPEPDLYPDINSVLAVGGVQGGDSPPAAANKKTVVHRDKKTKLLADWELPAEWLNWSLSNFPNLSYGEITNSAAIFKYDRLSKGLESYDWFSDYKGWMHRQLPTTNQTATKANGNGKYDPGQQMMAEAMRHFT